MTGQPLDLDAIRARADAATPGPWYVDGPLWADDPDPSSHREAETRSIVTAALDRARIADGDWDSRNEDAEFIAHARTDVPALIAEVEQLREEATWRRRLTDQCMQTAEWCARIVERCETEADSLRDELADRDGVIAKVYELADELDQKADAQHRASHANPGALGVATRWQWPVNKSAATSIRHALGLDDDDPWGGANLAKCGDETCRCAGRDDAPTDTTDGGQ